MKEGGPMANPATTDERYLSSAHTTRASRKETKSLTRQQLAWFLGAAMAPDATTHDRRHFPFFLCLARAGLRLGEVFALQWQDLDFAGQKIRAVRAFSDVRLDTPKRGHGRTVDMSQELARSLRRHELSAETDTIK